MLKNLKRAAAIVLSFAMAIQFGLANSYYVNAEEEPVEPQQEQTTTVENNEYIKLDRDKSTFKSHRDFSSEIEITFKHF